MIKIGGPGVMIAFALLAFSLTSSALLGLLQGVVRWRFPAALWLAPTSLLIALAGGSWINTLSTIRALLGAVEPSARYTISIAGHIEAASSSSLILLCAALSAAAAGAALGLANLGGAGPDARATPPQLAATAAACLLLPATLYGLWPLLPPAASLTAAVILGGALLLMSLGAARVGADPADASRSRAARLVIAALAGITLASTTAATFGLSLGTLSPAAPPTIDALIALDQAVLRGLAIGLVGALSTGAIMALATLGLPERAGRALSGAVAAVLVLGAASLPAAASLQHLSQTSALYVRPPVTLPELPPAPATHTATHTATPSSHVLIYDQRGTFKHALLDDSTPAPGCPPVGADLNGPLCSGLRVESLLVAIGPEQPAARLTSLLDDSSATAAQLLVGPIDPRPLLALSGAERLALRAVTVHLAGPTRWRASEDGGSLVNDPSPLHGTSSSVRAERVISGDSIFINGVRSPVADAAFAVNQPLAIVASPDLTVAALINRCVALAEPGQCHLIPALPAGFAEARPELTGIIGAIGDEPQPLDDPGHGGLGIGGLGLGEPADPDKLGQLGKIGVGKKTTPTVQLDPVTVGDGMRDVIRRVMLRNKNAMRYCYELGLRTNPNLVGTAKIKFVIGADGAVMIASLDPASTLDDPEVGACLVKATKRLLFPKPTGGAPITITYPLTFKSDE